MEKAGPATRLFMNCNSAELNNALAWFNAKGHPGIFENQGFKGGMLLGGNPGVGFLKVEGALVQGPAAYSAHQAGAEGEGVEFLHVG